MCLDHMYGKNVALDCDSWSPSCLEWHLFPSHPGSWRTWMCLELGGACPRQLGGRAGVDDVLGCCSDVSC